MSIAINTNVLVRILVQDPTAPGPCAAARRLVAEATVEEALYLLDQHPAADFTDCLLVARAAQLGRSRFLTFDF